MPRTTLATRRRILTRARTVLDRRPAATVADLAHAAGVSRASFYRAFSSRRALLAALEVAPAPGARDRILEAAVRMVGASGLSALSMEELADTAGVSRATLYRLFPGKPALFTALVRTYSPVEPVLALLETHGGDPPEKVLPEIARAVHRTVHAGGETRAGLLRALFFEVSSLSPDAEEAVRETLLKVIGGMVGYLEAQMQKGRLRRMHPVIALQAFIGPIFFHLITRPAADRLLSMSFDGEQAVVELAELWIRGMAAQERRNG